MPKAKEKAKPALNIRDIDPDLMAKLKADAAKHGVTLREWCIQLLSQQTDTQATIAKLTASIPEVTTASQLPHKEGDHPGQSTSAACTACGGPTRPWGVGWRRCVPCARNQPA